LLSQIVKRVIKYFYAGPDFATEAVASYIGHSLNNWTKANDVLEMVNGMPYVRLEDTGLFYMKGNLM